MQHAIISFLPCTKSVSSYLLLCSLLYLISTILMTIACNVPLNDSLAAVDPSSAHAGRVWTNYLKNWTTSNHVRTIAALAAAASFNVGLCHVGSQIDP